MSDHTQDDDAPQRPKWLGAVIVAIMLAVVLGLVNVGWLIMKPDPIDAAQAARVQASPALQAGQRLVQSNDCMRCHMAERKAVGPGYQDIAMRYQARSDAAAHLAGKIRNGSVGEWGRVIMPRHPQISPADAELMARWVLSHTPASAATP